MDIIATHFEDAVVAGDFGVSQIEVGAFAPDDEAGPGKFVNDPYVGTGDDGQDDRLGGGKLGGVVFLQEQRTDAGRVGASERWQW